MYEIRKIRTKGEKQSRWMRGGESRDGSDEVSNLLITREIFSSVKYKENVYGKQLILYNYRHRAQIYSRSRNNDNLKGEKNKQRNRV